MSDTRPLPPEVRIASAALSRYLAGSLPLGDVLAALRALPPSPGGSPWVGIDDAGLGEGERGRLARLLLALDEGDAAC